MSNANSSEGGNDKEEKEITIIINTREKTVGKKAILSFDDLVALAFPNPPTGENIMFSIMYRKGEDNKEGLLAPGETVKVKKGMIFNVSATDKS